MKSPARKPLRRRETRKSVKFLQKPTCATCRKARRFMEKRGVHLHYRDLVKGRLGVERLIGKHDHQDFLNPRSETFRKRR